jgi:hypothetical protein
MSVLANNCAQHGHKVTLITLGLVKDDFYALHAGVHRVELGLKTASDTLSLRSRVIYVD